MADLPKGDLSEIAVMKDLMQRGYKICVPYGHNHRFDILAYNATRFIRVQVKTALLDTRRKKERFVIRAFSESPSMKYKREYTSQEIDYIAGYCPLIDKVSYIPIKEFEKQNEISLRIDADDRNNLTANKKKIHYLIDFMEI